MSSGKNESTSKHDQALEFTEIFENHFSRIYRYFYIRVGDNEVAHDLTSETFLRAFQHFASFDNTYGRLEAWLFGIARNLLTDTFRRDARRTAKSHLADMPYQETQYPPELKVMRVERLNEVKEAMEFLKPREREVLALKFGASLTNKEIADLCGISIANTAVILHRTIKKLKALLTREGTEDE
ncbi:MAG: sigma-70 family RNA polymerase sigma factor [Anaerolineales bacterium]